MLSKISKANAVWHCTGERSLCRYPFSNLVTWNMLENSHCKEAPDAIQIQENPSTALQLTGWFEQCRYSRRMTTTLFQTELSNSDFTVHYILLMTKSCKRLARCKPVKPLSGSVKIHQLRTASPNYLSDGLLSCFCSRPMECIMLCIISFEVKRIQRRKGQQQLTTLHCQLQMLQNHFLLTRQLTLWTW